MPSSSLSSARICRSATESAPPEHATATRSPGRSSCCSRIYLRTFSSIETFESALYHCEIIAGLSTNARHRFHQSPTSARQNCYTFLPDEGHSHHSRGRSWHTHGACRQKRRAHKTVF